MRRFGVRPDRELGQNFLIDSNILGVIDRAAALAPQDVVLEIGGGLGVLSEYLRRARRARARGRDRRAPARRAPRRDGPARERDAALGGRDDARSAAACARRRTRSSQTSPTASAAGVLLRTIEQLPSVNSVGGDGAARGRRAPGGGAGRRRLRSALGARAAGLRGGGAARDPAHGVPPGAERRLGARAACAGAPARTKRLSPALRALVAGAFAHRRKTLAGSLALARRAALDHAPRAPARSREQIREALVTPRSPARTCARSASRRRTSVRSRACWSYEAPPRARPREGQPRPVRRTGARERRQARAGHA